MKACAKRYWILKLLTALTIICIICFSAIAEDANAPPAAPPAGDVNAPPAGDVNAPPVAPPVGYVNAPPVAPPVGDVNAPPAAPPAGDVNKPAVRAPFEQRMQKRISVEFRNTPMEDVIRIMAQQADIDVIKSPAVTGVVTGTLTNVPLEEALNNILAAHGYSYVLSENMIRVITAADKIEKPEPLQTKTYEIVYVDVKEVVKALDKFKSKVGAVSSIEGTSYIIVTDTESKIRDVTAFVEKVDRITPQILVEVRIYDIKSTEGFDIGTDWHVGRNTPITDVARTKTSGQSGTKTNNSTTTGTTTDVGPTMPVTTTTTTHTETTTDGVLTVEDKTLNTTTGGTAAGRTADTTTTTDTTGATNGGTSGDNVTETTAGSWLRDTYSKSSPFMGGLFSKEEGGTLRFGVLNDAVDIDLALNILHQQVGAKLLANPRILVLDNETAEFKIITEIPYTQQSETNAGGNMTSIQFKEVGVGLKVTPHVARDGMVRLHIVPEFGVVTKAGETTQSGVQTVPTVDTRKADTKTLVKDGQTVVLGGLRKRETTQDIRKVPVLGDLPLFGELFRSESESTTNSELVVFITVRIIKQQPVMSQGEQDAYKITDFKSPKPIYTGAESRENKK